MTMTVARWADLDAEPWRNGGGLTRQVSGGDGWRVSIADISADGPFSTFPNTDRVITLLDGPAPTLTVDGRDTRLELHRPFAFDGAASTSSRCDDATRTSRDLNLMTQRGACTGSVEITACRAIPAGGTVVAVVVWGRAVVGDVELERYDSVVLTEAVHPIGDALVAVIRIREATA